jgi:hypothetical protein
LKDVSIREDLPADVVAAAWMGYPGASEQEIVTLEGRLGKRLPASYRTFLAASNGWRQCGAFIYKLWPCSEVRWFRERNQEWIDAYVHPEDSGIEVVYPEGQSPPQPRPLTDEEYLVYGEGQDPCRFRTEHLQTALEISAVGDSAILLLNPEVISDAGEWEAWLFANWLPGAHRYRSFRELMQGEHESFRLFSKNQPSKAKYGNGAQQAARRGETNKAIVSLRKLAAGGDNSSAVSLAELCAFRGAWNEVITNLGRVISDLGAIPNFNGYPGDLLRLLGRAGHETGQWKQIAEFAGQAIAAEKKREYDQHHEHARSALIAWFKNLKGYCERRGGPPHELIRIFAVEDPVDNLSEAERRAEYEHGVNNDYTKRLKKKPAEYANHRFAIARNMKLDDEMIRIFEELPQAFYFDFALDVSRAYMRKGAGSKAWEVLRDRMHQCVAGLPEQVAPITLLIDDTLRPLMTLERCEFVLSIRRGREASKS